jgi:uncharacterized protein YcfJ
MKRVTQAVIAALGLAVAGSAFARYDDEVRLRMRDSFYDYARVMNVDRIVETVNQPVTREDCVKEPRDEYHPGTTYRRDVEEPIPGSYNSTTVRSEYVEQPGYYTRRVEDRCETRTEYQQTAPQTVAFDVVYRYDGQDFHERMNHNPGSRVRVHIDNGYVQVAE